jgi:hypothetical protein
MYTIPADRPDAAMLLKTPWVVDEKLVDDATGVASCGLPPLEAPIIRRAFESRRGADCSLVISSSVLPD